MPNSLEHFKSREYHGVRELARAAEAALRSVGTSQEKATVAEYPNERTIRYYITEGLLDKAIKSKGVTSVFGYEHLLTLLVIKKLQADGLPISVIKTVMQDRSIDELENLLGEEVRVYQSEADLQAYRDATGQTDDSDVMRIEQPMFAAAPDPKNEAQEFLDQFSFADAAEPKNEAKDFLESLLFSREQVGEEPSKPSSAGTARQLQPRSATTSDWRRYEIVEGVELHIARSFRPPQDDAFRKRLLVLIDGVLHSRERTAQNKRR